MTEAEYLEIERAAEFKSEFFGGEMFAMVDLTPRHSLVSANLTVALHNLLKGRSCLVFNSVLQIKVEATGLLTYADVTVVGGAQETARGHDEILVNPILLAEVFSDATEGYDRGRKFKHYRQIPSLLEYMIVSQNEPRVELFVRQANNGWLLREAVGLESKIELPNLQITVALSEIFTNVEFVPFPIRAATPRTH